MVSYEPYANHTWSSLSAQWRERQIKCRSLNNLVRADKEKKNERRQGFVSTSPRKRRGGEKVISLLSTNQTITMTNIVHLIPILGKITWTDKQTLLWHHVPQQHHNPAIDLVILLASSIVDIRRCFFAKLGLEVKEHHKF